MYTISGFLPRFRHQLPRCRDAYPTSARLRDASRSATVARGRKTTLAVPTTLKRPLQRLNFVTQRGPSL